MSTSTEKFSQVLNTLRPLVYVRAWKNCAGPALLKTVHFRGVNRFGSKIVLTLGVKSAVWHQELNTQKESILISFNRELQRLGAQKQHCATHCQIDRIYEKKTQATTRK